MIIVRTNGGLGNQMFQYATGRSLADRHGTDLLLDLSALGLPDGTETPRPFELDVFSARYRKAGTTDLQPFLRSGQSRGIRAAQKFFPFIGQRWFAQRGQGFDARVSQLPDPVYLDGYWQSERYFKPDEQQLRNDFKFREPATGLNAELTARMKGVVSVSVHVRRGDYVNDATIGAFHGTCDLPYYQRAVALVLERAPKAEFFLFSDDMAWVKENLAITAPVVFVEHNQGPASFNDMRLMAACRHHIIANSSFSWWGAWLNADPKKVVVAPKQWFRDPAIDTKDLVPETWIRI
ncbi:MAG: alpha-1,2-fucosyltransferase [Flavobacteriales bacterium]